MGDDGINASALSFNPNNNTDDIGKVLVKASDTIKSSEIQAGTRVPLLNLMKS